MTLKIFRGSLNERKIITARVEDFDDWYFYVRGGNKSVILLSDIVTATGYYVAENMWLRCGAVWAVAGVGDRVSFTARMVSYSRYVDHRFPFTYNRLIYPSKVEVLPEPGQQVAA